MLSASSADSERKRNDWSDILGILSEHEKRGTALTIEQIKKAFSDLYGDWNLLPESTRIFIENVMRNGSFENQYKEVIQHEQEANSLLTNFDQKYPGAINSSNADEIIGLLRKKQNQRF